MNFSWWFSSLEDLIDEDGDWAGGDILPYLSLKNHFTSHTPHTSTFKTPSPKENKHLLFKKLPTRVSMELSNCLVSWVVTYLGDLQPTYIGVIIYLLSTMDIPVVESSWHFLDTFWCARFFAPRHFWGWPWSVAYVRKKGSFNSHLGGDFKYFFISIPTWLGKWSNLTSIFFWWVVQPPFSHGFTIVGINSSSLFRRVCIYQL